MCRNSMKNNDTKDYSEQLEFLNSQPYYASKKLLSIRQIFRYAVPACTVTKTSTVYILLPNLLCCIFHQI